VVTAVQQPITQTIAFFAPNLLQHEIQNNTQQPSPLLGFNQQASLLIPLPINSLAVNDQDIPVMHLIVPTADASPATSYTSVNMRRQPQCPVLSQSSLLNRNLGPCNDRLFPTKLLFSSS